MNNWKGWVEAGKKLAIFPKEKTSCPDCTEGQLRVFDIPLTNDKSEFERVMFCGSCGSHNSLKMNDSHKFVETDFDLSEEELRILEDVKQSYSFAKKSNGIV